MPNNANNANSVERSGNAALSSHSQTHSGMPSSSAANRFPKEQTSAAPQPSSAAKSNHGSASGGYSNNKPSGQGRSGRTLSPPNTLRSRTSCRVAAKSTQSQNSLAQYGNQKHSKKASGRSLTDLLRGIIPSSVYDTKSKKLFGIFSVEDLLLVMLIFLLLEKENEDDNQLALALLYVLISDYIDLSGFTL